MNSEQYRASLLDGRRLFHDGVLVPNVNEHPGFQGRIERVAQSYDEEQSAFRLDAYKVPRTVADLRERAEAMVGWEESVMITMESLLALTTAGGRMPDGGPYDTYRRRIEAFADYCTARDLRLVLAITDAKGDRALSPANQGDPDAYLRVVERRDEGIVVNGAKLHISMAALSHELVVIPERRMKPGEEEWAVACAVPVGSPGVTILNTITGTPLGEEDYHPLSAGREHIDGFVVFDHVFVPNERVFLCGEVEHSSLYSHALGLWNRTGQAAHAADAADEMVGIARLLAEANGTEKISHIKDKIVEMILFATIVRAGLEAAIENAVVTPEGIATPNELYINVTKYYFASNLDRMRTHIIDIAGGSLVTAPLPRDLHNPETRPYVEKYMATRDGIEGNYRTRLFHAARDLTISVGGGFRHAGLLLGGGGLHAQKVVATKHYDIERAKAMARRLAKLDEGEGDEQP